MSIVSKITSALLLTGSLLMATEYKVDNAHTNVGFTVKHMMITNVKGDFKTYEANIDFDKDNLAERLSWKGADCQNFVYPASTTVVQQVNPVAPVVTEILNLSADALFKFDGSSLNDLLPQGRVELDNLASNINNVYSQVNKIHLIGHTDRLGSDAYNYQLGSKRAQTVRNYLSARGIPNHVISYSTQGESQPLTDGCYTVKNKQALQECLHLIVDLHLRQAVVHVSPISMVTMAFCCIAATRLPIWHCMPITCRSVIYCFPVNYPTRSSISNSVLM